MNLISNERLADLVDGMCDQIEKRGWTRGAFVRSHESEKGQEGAVCMLGGLTFSLRGEDAFSRKFHPMTARETELYVAARNELLMAIHRTGSRARSVEGWNDYRHRTVQQVLDVGRDCAKWLRMHDAAG